MNEIQATQLQSLRAAQQFLDAHGPRIGTINSSGARRRLDESVTEAEQCLTDQAAAKIAGQGETRRYQQLRRALVTLHMDPIAGIAQVAFASTPDVSALSVPRGNPSVARLVAAARGMARVAAPHAAIFTEAGLPVDFVARLSAATDAVQASFAARVRHSSDRRIATASVGRALLSGRQQLRILVALVRREPAQPTLFVDLQACTRIPRRPRRAAAAAAMATATTTATVTATLVLLEPCTAPRALPAPAPVKLLTSGAPPAVVEESRAPSMLTAVLPPFRRKAG